MQRKTALIAGVAGLAVAGMVSALGLVMAANARFATSYTTEQLDRQNITFSPLDALTEEERRSSCLVRYAGQPLTTGAQAECYANDYIGLHVREVAGGKTYAELGGPERALQAKVVAAARSGDPALADLQRQHASVKAQRDALFQGETSRGLLLTSYGFSVLGAKADQAAFVAFTIASVLALLSVTILLLRWRPRYGTLTARGPAEAITAGAVRPDAVA